MSWTELGKHGFSISPNALASCSAVWGIQDTVDWDWTHSFQDETEKLPSSVNHEESIQITFFVCLWR